MKKIIEIGERANLNEGRNYGIGFSILSKAKTKDKYKTLIPFTACRDYLNDFTYVEDTKKEIGVIHGYNHKLLNCFDNRRIFYLGVNTLNYNSNIPWNLKDDATKLLIDNKDNLQRLINKVENEIGLNIKTTIQIDEDVLILRCPIYWSKSTALISVFTLLIRCYFNFVYDESKPLVEQLANHKCFISADDYMKNEVVNFIKNINTYNYTKIDYNTLKIKSTSSIHNFGIQGYLNIMKKQHI